MFWSCDAGFGFDDASLIAWSIFALAVWRSSWASGVDNAGFGRSSSGVDLSCDAGGSGVGEIIGVTPLVAG